MEDPKTLLPPLVANIHHLRAWEQGFVRSVEEQLSLNLGLSRKQHDRLAVIHTRMEFAGQLGSSHK